jgi:hypothetical protein
LLQSGEVGEYGREFLFGRDDPDDRVAEVREGGGDTVAEVTGGGPASPPVFGIVEFCS